MRASRNPAVLVTGIILSACGGDTTAPPAPMQSKSPGIVVVSGGGATDTVQTLVDEPLVIEVRDTSGRQVPNAAVRFNSIAVPSVLYPSAHADVYPVGPAGFNFATTVTDTTDSTGRASVGLRLGVTAGDAPLEVEVPSLGLLDTLSFVVRPGNGVAVTVTPHDTGLVAGKSLQLHASVVDAAGNPRAGAVTFKAVQAPAGTLSSTGVASATAVGQLHVLATSGALIGGGTVEVVPDAVIAAYRPSLTPGAPAAIATMKLDGSQYHEVAPITGSSHDIGAPAWAGAGSLIFGTVSAGDASRLQVATAAGVVSPLNAAGTPGANDERWPAYSVASGATYYMARMSGGQIRIWVRSASGTLADARVESDTSQASDPSVSPDGTMLVYGNGSDANPVISAVRLNAPSAALWRTSGDRPAWSPRGDVIAYLSSHYGSPIQLIDADGTHPRTLTVGAYSDVPLSWSPDGAWLIARDVYGSVNLISFATGVEIPLQYLARFWDLSWKPE